MTLNMELTYNICIFLNMSVQECSVTVLWDCSQRLAGLGSPLIMTYLCGIMKMGRFYEVVYDNLLILMYII